MELGSVSPCAFRRADGAVRCCRGSCGDVDVKTGKDRAIPGYLLCRTFLLCFFCLPLCSLNQWELVCLTSLFQASGLSSTLAFFPFASPAVLVWISPLLAIYPTLDGLSNGKAFPSCLPVCSIFLQMSFSRLQIRVRCPAPTDQRF